jgi:hypothetical protein
MGNFNLRRVAASLTFHWELSVVKEIRFHFRKPQRLAVVKNSPGSLLNLGRFLPGL